MDVSVRAADAAEDTSLTTVTGFYGKAIGAAGGGSLTWNGAQGADGDGDGDGDGDDAEDETNKSPQPPKEQTPQPTPQPEPPEEEE
jgi:hypothetical protein